MVNARTIVGIVGNVVSFGLFLSPVATFWRIIRKKDVEEFHPYAYIAACLNCMFWILYGLPVVHPDSTLVITINAVGLALELIYLSIFCLYDRQKRGRRVVGLGILAEVIFVGVIAIITFLAFHTHTSRSMFVGILCDIFNIIMYASPLTIWHKVITTKSVEYMPFFLSLANFANGCIWTAYALIKLDIYILVSNGLGAILGFIQLVIYACYYKSTPKKGNDDDFVKPKPTEVQHSGAAMA
ncbi:Bidirectional sugar transporter SWEET [Citrus sinensis]|uniref:Bidirectional sugar transporter SWEET n=1 Tax=Citrus sinensis TaxID=2711 RepID=A0ACB8IAQ4_CITSI|nr:Bidirectional sugar transporter SWEET [Citrus sinensis]